MKEVIDNIRTRMRKRKEASKKRSRLFSRLIELDNKCRILRLQMARKNKKALSKSQYQINGDKVEQLIYLSLQQLEVREKLKYGNN